MPDIQSDVDAVPDFSLRGTVDHGHADRMPTRPLIFAILGTAAAVAIFTRGIGVRLGDVGALLGGALALLVILAAVLLVGWLSRRSGLWIYGDRVVVHGSADDGRTIRYRDMQRVRRHGARIEILEADGRRFAFRGARLHIEDAFDVLAQRIEAGNPGCVVEDAVSSGERSAP